MIYCKIITTIGGYMKNTWKNLIKPSCKVGIINNRLFLEIEGAFAKYCLLKVKGKLFEFTNNKVWFPLSYKKLSDLCDGKFYFCMSILGKKIYFKVSKNKITICNDLLEINGERYIFVKDAYIYINISEDNNDCIISYKKIGTTDLAYDDDLLILNMDYEIVKRYSIKNKQVIIKDIDDLLNAEHKLQLFVTTKDVVYPLVLKRNAYEKYNHLCVEEFLGKVYLQKNNDEFVTKGNGLTHKILPIMQKYIYLKSVHFDNKKEQVDIKLKEGTEDYDNFAIYLKNLKTQEREQIYISKREKIYTLSNLDKIMSKKINHLDRYLFEFEVCSQEKEVLERNYLCIPYTKKRGENVEILFQSCGNQLVLVEDNILVLENSSNHFQYAEKKDFCMQDNCFSTDVDIICKEKDTSELKLEIISLLSEIKRYKLYLRDSYTKKTYFFYEKEVSIPNKYIRDTIKIDIERIKELAYYNARFNFRIEVEYLGGYKEYGMVMKKRQSYKTIDRYLYTYEDHETQMVTAFYIGENLYNLNVWYTSSEEFEKGVAFQVGREKYYTTLKEEVDNNLIMFEANLGKDYTGNPKYLYEYMLGNEKYSSYKYAWAYPANKEASIPGNPILVERGTPEYFYYLGKAKYWINNILFPVKEKREETVYLQTWHGTPLKKLGFDIEVEGPEKQAFGNLYEESQNWDYLLVDNDYGEDKLVGAFRFKKQVIKEGYPINDIFYNDKLKMKAKNRLVNKYPAIQGKKIILYAPTWRDLQGDYVRGYDFELPFDLEKLYQALQNEYVLIVKLHHLIADKLAVDQKYADFFVNASSEEDVMELLCLTDVLITDYSSVFYDFASAKKPILFYMYDMDEYLTKTRGLYVDIDTLPGPILKTEEELLCALENIQNYQFESFEKLRMFCEEMAKYCHGCSSKRVLDIVIKE